MHNDSPGEDVDYPVFGNPGTRVEACLYRQIEFQAGIGYLHQQTNIRWLRVLLCDFALILRQYNEVRLRLIDEVVPRRNIDRGLWVDVLPSEN